MKTMLKKFYLNFKISLTGGFDMKYFTLALKYLAKAIETITIIGPVIRGLASIWKPKKKVD